MKKKLLLIVLVMGICSMGAFSQSSWSLGVNAYGGFSFYVYTGDDYDHDATFPSLTLGVAFTTEYTINPMFSVVGNLGYDLSVTNFYATIKGLSAPAEVTDLWHKLALETLFRVKFTDREVNPFVQLGPRFSLLLSGSREATLGSDRTTDDIHLDSRFLMGYSLGVGIETKLEKMNISYGINYKGDFTQFTKDVSGKNHYANSITASITILF